MSVKRTQPCPGCGTVVTMRPYDIGSGPEMSCPNCETCWGADGQMLDPNDPINSLPDDIRARFGL